MPLYEVSERHYFRPIGRKLHPGQVVELLEDEAAALNAAHPGLLREARVTTQDGPAVARRGRRPKHES